MLKGCKDHCTEKTPCACPLRSIEACKPNERLTESECKRAANLLGSKEKVHVVNEEHTPPGCMNGNPTFFPTKLGEAYIIFNEFSSGPSESMIHYPICKKDCKNNL